MDARSGVITCVYLTDNTSSQASIYSLRRGIIKYGIPKNVYLDNGREFLTFDFGGRGHRAKKNDDRYAPPPILERLGINMVNAIVRNAKAKTIERRFLDFKNNISKLFTTYIGGNVIERPEILKVELKNGNIPDRETFIKQIEDLIEYYLNYEPYNGSVAKDRGKRKIDVYKENLHTKIMATDEDLSLMMLRSTRTQKVTRNGVHLNIKGAKINYRNNDLVMQCLNKEVYLLDMTAIIAGTQFRGQFESRMKALVDECKTYGNIILVIDEIHNIIGAGDAEHSMNAANILKPSLSNGEIQLIGTTTLKEYRKYIEKDSALERRFQQVLVEEPNVEDSIGILDGIKKYYEEYHKVKISIDVIRQTVIMSEKYIHDRFLPDKAIDILDEACSRINLDNKELYRLEILKTKLKQVQEEKSEAADADSTEDYQKAADLKTKECQLIDEISLLSKKLK